MRMGHIVICGLSASTTFGRYLMKLEFSGKFSFFFFEKILNMTFQENPSSETRVVPCGQTDRHDEANSHFSQFCERASKRVKCGASTKTLTTLPHTVSYCSQVDRQKKAPVCTFLSSFPRVLHTPLTSCFLVSSKRVLLKIRLKSEGKPSI